MFWKSVFKGGFLSVFTDKITKYVVPVGGADTTVIPTNIKVIQNSHKVP